MRLTKIFFGEQLIERFNCDGKRYTKWQIFKFRVKSFFRRLMWLCIAGLVVLAIVQYARWAYPLTIVNIKETKVEVDTLTPKIKELKVEVLNKLQSCESGGFTEDDGLIIYDSNKVASIGLYQFQKKTVIFFYKSIYGKDITGKQAIEIALDAEKSRELAEDIIFTTDKGIDNWYNCKNKNNLAENIKWIKKITE